MHLYPIHLPNPKPTMNKPNIHDIIDLAYQVEQTRDPDIKAGLKRYLLYLINSSYSDIQPPEVKPYKTPYNLYSCKVCGENGIVCGRFDCPTRVTKDIQPPVTPYLGCSICGLNGINGYVCYRSDCPTKITC